MNDPTPSSYTPPRISLSPGQRRVLGVLIEKAKTTPAGYPMTVNAIVTGCNQRSNREPLMDLNADDVEEILEQLRVLGLVVEAPESTRSTKFRHRAYEWFKLERPQLAVLTELLLRGDQTLGDLRARAARFEPIADMAALKPLVDVLLERELMIELTPAGRGQVVSHNLYQEHELAELKSRYAGGGRPVEPRPVIPYAAAAPASDPTAIAALRDEVARLAERVAALEARIPSETDPTA
jgi:uncharacterized protein YceH (UPF0502 family)